MKTDLSSTDPIPASASEAPSFERSPDLTFYKPNAKGSGGVIRFGLNRSKGAIFAEAAPQSGERQFDWERKIVMKWGIADIGAVLATLQGGTPEAKLFHQSEKANSAFDLLGRDETGRAPYFVSMSRQENGDKSLRKVSLPVSHGEAAVLEAALRAAVVRILGW